jgi:hypothetical protein
MGDCVKMMIKIFIAGCECGRQQGSWSIDDHSWWFDLKGLCNVPKHQDLHHSKNKWIKWTPWELGHFCASQWMNTECPDIVN